MKDLDSSNFDDEDLWSRIKLSDYQAFEIVYHKYATLMFNTGYALLKNKSVCEDMLQEVFVNIWASRNRLVIKCLKFYLLKSMRNQVLLHLKKQRSHISLALIENNVASFEQLERSIINKQEIGVLFQKLETLPQKCKEVFLLSRKYQLSNREISEKLNISVKTVENQITIAIKKLKPVTERLFSYYIIMLCLKIIFYLMNAFRG